MSILRNGGDFPPISLTITDEAGAVIDMKGTKFDLSLFTSDQNVKKASVQESGNNSGDFKIILEPDSSITLIAQNTSFGTGELKCRLDTYTPDSRYEGGYMYLIGEPVLLNIRIV